MTAATSNPRIRAAAPWSVLITGPTGSGKTCELGRHLARASEEGAETWAAARRPADLDVLAGLADIPRMAAAAEQTAAMISDAHDQMSQRYGLIESGDASAGDFTWLVLAVDDYPLIGNPAGWPRDEHMQAERLAEECRRPVSQLLTFGEAVRIGVALTAPSRSFIEAETRGLRIRHVSLPAPPHSGHEAPGASAGTASCPGPPPRRRPGKTVLPVIEAAAFLYLVRVALRLQRAHLAAAAGDGPAADGHAVPACGWNKRPGGGTQPSGPCIGTASADGPGGRVYLLPLAAYEAARTLADDLGIPFTLTFPQLHATMRDSGLLPDEISLAAGHRHTVLRRVAGGTFRVWDVPADALLGTGTGGAG